MRSLAILGDKALWLMTLLGAAAGAAYGLRFGPSIGESPLVGAVALGILGLAPGFVAGLVMAGLRVRTRARTAAETDRIRFVDSLNQGAQPDSRYSIDPADGRALVMDLSRSGDPDLRPEIQALLRAKIEQLLQADTFGASVDLRRHGFERWIVRLNGTTLLERAVAEDVTQRG